MEHLLDTVERTLRSTNRFARRFWAPWKTNQTISQMAFVFCFSRRARLLGVGNLLDFFRVADITPLPYVHPSTLVFAEDQMYVIDWFRKVLYHHDARKGLPITLVENIPNNFISGCAISEKFLFTLDGFRPSIAARFGRRSHVIKQFPTPVDGRLVSSNEIVLVGDEEERKFHIGADTETNKSEYRLPDVTVTSLYYFKNRL